MLGFFEVGFLNLTWQSIVMLIIGVALLYLGIAKNMEPLLLVPIGFGVILVNLPLGGLMETIVQGKVYESYVIGGEPAGLLSRIFYYGLTWEIIPPLIFLGLGAMTDFGPLLANPKTLILGAGAQFGVYFSFFVALLLGGAFPDVLRIGINEAASIGIIGGADGPTTIYLTSKLAPELMGITAVAAYSYMAMVAIIQPPIIRALTTKKERETYMESQQRQVSKREKILFPLVVTILVILLVPRSAPLVGMFMFGNLIRESGVVERLSKSAQNSLINIVTIILMVSIGASMPGELVMRPETLMVLALGLVAFICGTAGGVLLGKLMKLVTKEPFNPIIGAAGVSAVPMAARVAQHLGQKENPRNFLLMHAIGPNVAGVIGSAVVAGVFLSILG